MQSRRQAFALGQVVATPGALNAFSTADENIWTLIMRHVRCDFGDMCQEDIDLNLNAVKFGGRIMSSYTLSNGIKVWLITEADRSATTALLPGEY